MPEYSTTAGPQACTPNPEAPVTVGDDVLTTVGTLEYAHRVLHAVNVRTLMVALCGFPRDHEDAGRQKIAREISLQNRERGWATIALSGNEEEDVADYSYIDPAGIHFRARPINRRREPALVSLDRPRLELLLLAQSLLQGRFPSVFDRTDPAARGAAVEGARALLAADWPAALDRIAVGVFRGSQEQRLRQLGWLLDGSEPDLVVCHHCYHLVAPSDPAMDREDEDAARQRRYDARPRYSAHAACQAAHGAGAEMKVKES